MILEIITFTVLAFGVIFASVMLRPGYSKIMESFNSTIYSMEEETLITQWLKHYNAMNYLYWIVPGILVIGLIILMWAVYQRREYVTAGGYM